MLLYYFYLIWVQLLLLHEKNWKQFSFSYSLEQFVFSETIWICLQSRRRWFDSWVGNITWRRDRLPVPGFMAFPGGSDGKESVCSVGNLGLIPGLGRSPGGGHGNPLQYSCLENPMDRKAWQSYGPGFKKSWIRLSD